MPLRVDDLADLAVRVGRNFSVVAWDDLSPGEQQELRAWGSTATRRVLRCHRGASPRPLDHRSALALDQLREPGPFPFHLFRSGAADVRRRLAAWLADGVLEIVDRADPESAAAAARCFERFYAGVFADQPAPRGFLAQLSQRAVRWAAQMPDIPVRNLRRRLYDFNRQPLSAPWSRRLPDRPDVVRFLGADRAPPPGWRMRRAEGWLGLERLDVQSRAPPRLPAGPFKLYVSPLPHHTPRVLEGLWPLLGQLPLQSLKVADSAVGLLRPEKLVVYAAGLESIAELARRLLDAVDVPAHGVPFSAEIGGRGLVSWGVDRHRGDVVRSWRAWLIHRLAEALSAPVAAGGRSPTWRRALERVRLEGVDIARWQPSARMWLPDV